jgi:hypothetical protein
MDAPPVNREDMRACIRARLVALAEEVNMISQQKPTEAQLRQHALDRALQPDIVQGLNNPLAVYGQENLTPDGWARAITLVADVFVEYLRGPAEEPAERHDGNTMDKVLEALNSAEVGKEQAMDAIADMQNAGILFRERA